MSGNEKSRGIRVLPLVSVPIDQKVFEELRNIIQKAAISWGVAYVMVFPDGSGLAVRAAPTCTVFFCGSYGKHFTSADLRSDIIHHLEDIGQS